MFIHFSWKSKGLLGDDGVFHIPLIRPGPMCCGLPRVAFGGWARRRSDHLSFFVISCTYKVGPKTIVTHDGSMGRESLLTYMKIPSTIRVGKYTRHGSNVL